MLYVLGAVGVLIAAFIWWRWTSVGRGMRQRDRKLFIALAPIADRLSQRQPVAAEEVAALCRRPEYRPLVHQMLKHYERLDLFPREALSIEAQGAGILAHWMMHPNELQDAPEAIELVEEVQADAGGGRSRFLVYRYRIPAGHWAEKQGWLLGVAGPFRDGDAPYSGVASGFSRCEDKHGEVKPSELADWFAGVTASSSA